MDHGWEEGIFRFELQFVEEGFSAGEEVDLDLSGLGVDETVGVVLQEHGFWYVHLQQRSSVFSVGPAFLDIQDGLTLILSLP